MNRRIKAGFKGVTGYGFKALEGLDKKSKAKATFDKMDDNGGGIVLLEEWCEFIKAAEIEAGTALGKSLAADEEGGKGKKWSAPKAKKDAIGKDGKPLNKAKSSSGGGFMAATGSSGSRTKATDAKTKAKPASDGAKQMKTK